MAVLARAGLGSWLTAVAACGSAQGSAFVDPSATDGASSDGSGTDGRLVPRLTDASSTADSAQGTCTAVQRDAGVETTEKVVEIPGNVLFIFSQSSTMETPWAGLPQWQVAKDAIFAAIQPLQTKLSAGAILFPTTPAMAGAPSDAGIDDGAVVCDDASVPCPADASAERCAEVAPISIAPQLSIQTGSAFANAWATYWQSGSLVLQVLQTGAPIEEALLQAERALLTPPVGTTAVVVVTDGAPTCGSNESSVAARILKAKNIRTYVVGLPGAERDAALLDSIAVSGGTALPGCASPCYLAPPDPTELQKELASIASATVTASALPIINSCTMTVSYPQDAGSSPPHLVALEVASGRQVEIPQAAGLWSLAPDGGTATLEGAFCEKAKAGLFVGFRYQYGCVRLPKLSP